MPEQMDRSLDPHAIQRNHRRKKCREGGSISGETGSAYGERIPAEEKSRQVAKSLPKVNVLAPSVWHHCSQFSQAQRSGQRKQSRCDPCCQYQGGRTDFLRHHGRLQKHTCANNDPDHQRSGVRQRQVPLKLMVFVKAWH
jgi:hypothetical protein